MDNVLFGGMVFLDGNKKVNMNYTIKNLNIHGEIEFTMEEYTKAIGEKGLDGIKKHLVNTLKQKLDELLQSMEIEGK